MSDIFDLTALELGAAIRQGEVSPTQAARAALDRMEETKENGAFVAVTADRALDRAREIEQQLAAGKCAGPLTGVPMALKDNICTKGVSTTCASKILTGFVPPMTPRWWSGWGSRGRCAWAR